MQSNHDNDNCRQTDRLFADELIDDMVTMNMLMDHNFLILRILFPHINAYRNIDGYVSLL